MKKLIIPITIIISVFFTSQLFSSKLLKQVEPGEKSYKKEKKQKKQKKQKVKKKKSAKPAIKLSKNARYTIEQTARILRSKGIVNFQLDHDDHVYKCIQISNNSRDLEGAVDAIDAYDTYFGDTLDKDEVNLIIRISKIKTFVYRNIGRLSKKIGKKQTTVKEHFNILNESEKKNEVHLYNGIERARACSYYMTNDYFSKKRISLFVNIGKIKDEERFFDIYSAMRRVGMDKKINFISLEILYKCYLLRGNVAYKIKNFLQENKWRSRKQLSKREYFVIRDMMYANENPYPMGKSKKKYVKKKRRKVAKRKYYFKKKKRSKPKKRKFFNDPCSQIINK